MTETATMVVSWIDDQGDRILFYKLESHLSRLGPYHAIADPTQDGVRSIQVGDRIIYEPYGINFGWFVRPYGTNQEGAS